MPIIYLFGSEYAGESPKLSSWNPPAFAILNNVNKSRETYQLRPRWVWWKFHLNSVLRPYAHYKALLQDFRPSRSLIEISYYYVLFPPNISLNRRRCSSLGLSWGFEEPDQIFHCSTGLWLEAKEGPMGTSAWYLSPILTFDVILVLEI